MKLWMIVNRNGNPYYSWDGYGFTGKTRKACIHSLCGPSAYYCTVAEVWASWQRQGYDCVRVEVKPWHNSDAKRERDGEAASDE